METHANLLQVQLLQMAAQANLPTLAKYGPNLPTGWVNIGSIASTNSMPPPVPQSQGFLALGPVDADGNQGYVLALGVTWSSFLLNQYSGTLLQTKLPDAIAGSGQPPNSLVSQPHAYAYQQMREAAWTTLKHMNAGLPLYICGMGLGAPLAQIGALDLRPGNKGPADLSQIAVQPTSYAFSAVNFVNQDFANYYQTIVTDANVVWAGTQALPVDLFPTRPDNADFVQIGRLTSLSCTIPSGSNAGWLQLPPSSQPYDVPWLERSDVFYLNALGGTPESAPVISVSIPQPPGGFSQVTAASMAILTQASYQLSRSITGTTGNVAPYQFTQYVNYQGTPFAFIFESAAAVAVVFRGTVTWQEFFTLEANANFSTPSFITAGRAHVHSGAYTVYSGPVDVSSSAATFAETLLEKLKPLASGKQLYFTGHGLGGTVATLAAADYAMSEYGVKPDALYTFGATYPGDYDFAEIFSEAYKSSYQLIRSQDKIPGSIVTLGFSPVNNVVSVNGQLAVDESTFHALFGYLVLLNPAGTEKKAATSVKNDPDEQ